ncbi:MAG: hypothetical protein ACPIOQ_28930, partial [Promethearchaeia archaeon]
MVYRRETCVCVFHFMRVLSATGAGQPVALCVCVCFSFLNPRGDKPSPLTQDVGSPGTPLLLLDPLIREH